MDADKDRRRGVRRDHTARIGARERARHLAYPHSGAVACYACDKGNTGHFWAKRKAGGCGCRAKAKGRPKVPGGLCSYGYWGKWRDTVNQRIAAHRLCHQWVQLVAANDPLDVEL